MSGASSEHHVGRQPVAGERRPERRHQALEHQGGLARTRDAGHRHQAPAGNGQLKGVNRVDGHRLEGNGAVLEHGVDRRALAHPHALGPGQKAADARARGLLHLLDGALGHDGAAVGAGAGPHLDQMVRRTQHLHVVVHGDHRVAVGEQVVDDREQPVDVHGVQPDARLVEHVEHPGGAVAHGPGQLHALALAGRERGARAVEREVAQPQLLQPGGRLGQGVHDGARHGPQVGQARLGCHGGHPGHELVEGLLGGLRQVDAARRCSSGPWR